MGGGRTRFFLASVKVNISVSKYRGSPICFRTGRVKFLVEIVYWVKIFLLEMESVITENGIR